MGMSVDATASGWEVTVTRRGALACVTAVGELDIATAPQLETALAEIEADGHHVTLDLRALTFMDSSGINLLMRHAARARSENFVLSIIAPPLRVARVLEVAGVAEQLPLVRPSPRQEPRGAPWPGGLSRSRAGPLRVSVEETAGAVRLTLTGELDLASAPELRQAVDAYARHGQRMIIDLSGLEFIDSMGLAALVRARHRAHARGGRLELVAGPHAVHATFILTGLHAQFDWVPGASSA